VGDPALDARNADFWDELCGTTLALAVGATGRTPDDLHRFDYAYLDFYPYLLEYVPEDLTGNRVLEVGLGYGTLGSVLVERGASYTGVDIAPGPVEMMRHRIELAGRSEECDSREASALELPFPDAEFDSVYSIGCLHHTGDLARAVAEVRRVLRPGGRAVVMVYDRLAARRVFRAPFRAAARLFRRDTDERMRAMYDKDSAGRAAPHTDFVSAAEARRLFSDFRSTKIQRRNISVPYVPRGPIRVARRALLATRIDQFIGLNLYIRAVA
jgi:SAM-dependent methyltransferase